MTETDRDRPLLVLASASPRRHELLGRFGVAFDVRPVDLDESPRAGEPADALVRRLAVSKATAGLEAAVEPEVVVLAADTVVVVDGRILGKPTDPDDAARMLRSLSGRAHEVLTGVAVAHRGGGDAGGGSPEVVLGAAVGVAVDVVTTEVTFAPLSDADVAWYVGSGEPLDKAGAYGIQGRGGIFVTAIDGSYDNVVGLPLAVTRVLLSDAGIDLVG